MELLMIGLRIISVILICYLLFFAEKETESIWAWILLLLTFPLAGIFLYLLTGQGIPVQEKNYEAEVKEGMTEDNLIEIFTFGEQKYEKLFADIKKAKREILLQYYIFQNDFLFEKLCGLLCEKASRGVEIKLMYDSFGSRKIPKKRWKYLKTKGIKVRKFKPGLWNCVLSKISGINYRNHRKIVVIDADIAYVGGINVGKEYLGLEPRFGDWRDTHFRMQGTVVFSLRKIFEKDWGEELEAPEEKKGRGKTPLQIVTSGPSSIEPHIRNIYLRCIGNAVHKIQIQTPYFIPDTVTLNALKLALLSGKEVELMIPCKPDHMFVYWATRYYAARLLALGAKIYLYQEGFLHAKGMIMDGEIYCYGTANMDVRSFFLNYEVNVICYGKEEVQKMCRVFEADRRFCHQLTCREYAQRSLKIRIKEQLSRLLSPLL